MLHYSEMRMVHRIAPAPLRAALFLFITACLSSCGSSSSDSAASSSAACTISSSPFPVTTSGVNAAPSRSDLLYAEIYSATATAATNKGVSNPLKVTPAEALIGDGRYYAAAVEAYAWGLPAEQFWEKQGLYFTGSPSLAVNTLYLSDSIDTGTTIVSPNTSVLYANGFLDLSVNPYLVNYPQSSTYNVLQVMDAYTNVQASVGSRINTCGSVVLYYANASYAEQVKAAYPNNSVAVYTPQAWLIGRVAVDTYAVQTQNGIPQTTYQSLYGVASSALALWKSQNVMSQYSLKALTNFTNTNGGSVKQSSAPTANSATQFFTNLSAAINQNKLLVNYAGVINGVLNMTSNVYDQTAIFNTFSLIGLTSSGYDASLLSPTQTSLVSNGYTDAITAIGYIATGSSATSATNYWSINTTLGQYKPDYAGWITAAATAKVGLGANLPADGTYPQLTVDSSAAPLTGASGNSYSLNFSNVGIPPITTNNGFWSVTVYDSNNNIYSSTTNTYYYTSQVGGVYALGSIQLAAMGGIPTLYFQNSVPSSSAKLPYWIPVPSGVFSVLMRLYNPVAANTTGVSTILNPFNGISSASSPQWIPPVIVKQ
jgi:hypothetical protein